MKAEDHSKLRESLSQSKKMLFLGGANYSQMHKEISPQRFHHIF